jgi:hypothetical protein
LQLRGIADDSGKHCYNLLVALIKNAGVLALLAIIAIALHVGYRYWDASHGDSQAYVCALVEGGFKASLTDKIYGDGGYQRENFVNTSRGQEQFGHIITMPDGTSYLWYDGYSKGIRGTLDQIYSVHANAVFIKGSCEPWWFPDKSYFQLPENVEFGDSIG